MVAQHILGNPGSFWHPLAVMNQTKWLPRVPTTDRNVLVEKQLRSFHQVKNYIINNTGTVLLPDSVNPKMVTNRLTSN